MNSCILAAHQSACHHINTLLSDVSAADAELGRGHESEGMRGNHRNHPPLRRADWTDARARANICLRDTCRSSVCTCTCHSRVRVIALLVNLRRQRHNLRSGLQRSTQLQKRLRRNQNHPALAASYLPLGRHYSSPNAFMADPGSQTNPAAVETPNSRLCY